MSAIRKRARAALPPPNAKPSRTAHVRGLDVANALPQRAIEPVHFKAAGAAGTEDEALAWDRPGVTQIATPLAPSSAVGAVSAAAATVAAAGPSAGARRGLRAGREDRGQEQQPGAIRHRNLLGRQPGNVASAAVWTK